MSAGPERAINIPVEVVTPDQQQQARELIFEDCRAIEERGALEAFMDMQGPAGVEETAKDMGVRPYDARFKLYLTMMVSKWASDRLQAWGANDMPQDDELVVICAVYDIKIGPGHYYDDLRRKVASAHEQREAKLAHQRRLIQPSDKTLAQMWALRDSGPPRPRPQRTLQG